MSTYTICITNQKGGVGKTTTAVNLAAGLALEDQDTLLIDLDPQGNASSGLGVDTNTIKRGVYHTLIGMGDIDETAIISKDINHLRILPANRALFGAEVELVDAISREYRLKEALGRMQRPPKYVIIDCPPSLGLLTINALTAAQSALIPLQTEYYALEGLSQLTKTVQLIQRRLNPELRLEGILLTMFDTRNNLSHQVATEVRSHFKDAVFDVVIPRNVRLSESPSFGKPIYHYDQASRGAKAYRKLAQLVIDRHGLSSARKGNQNR